MDKILKVLVVDDSQTNRLLFTEILGQKAKCDEAENGVQAWKLYNKSLNEGAYDIVLLDIAMPKMDGNRLLKLVRELESFEGVKKGKGLPILVITAHKEKIKEAIAAGASDYLFKPVNPDELWERINNLI